MSNTTPQHPGRLIKAAMKAGRFRQNAFSAGSGIAPTHLSSMLSGKRPMSPGLFVALERAGVGEAEVWAFLYARYEVHMARG